MNQNIEQNFIDGHWRVGRGSVWKRCSPADGELLWDAPAVNHRQVVQATAAARKHFVAWQNIKFDQRWQIIQSFQDILTKHREELSELISQETGKPLWESRTEVTAMIKKIDISHAAYQERCQSKRYDLDGGIVSQRYFKAHGVMLVLGPFNLPAHLPNGHIVPALLSGNVVILKPSEQTPLTGAFYTRLWQKAGLPDGVLQLLQGGGEVGRWLVADDQIQGVLFTGSYQTGLKIHQQLVDQPWKIMALEMGGNNPLVIESFTDLTAAVYCALLSAWMTTGQRCVCARRMIVVESEKTIGFMDAFVNASQHLKVGHWRQPDVFCGPLIDQRAVEHIQKSYQQLLNLGGSPLLTPLSSSPCYLKPGIIDVTVIEMTSDIEYFGPLLMVERVKDFASAIQRANTTAYGLSAGLISLDETHFETFINHINAGIINWNRPLTGASSQQPFGGVGQSGNHRPSAYFAADYCAYPVATLKSNILNLPKSLLPGVVL